jgi:hypothetical protein
MNNFKLNKNFFKFDFLNKKKLKEKKSKLITILSIIIGLILVIFAPWFIQFILNFLFLMTSFVVFTIIYFIIKMFKELIK